MGWLAGRVTARWATGLAGWANGLAGWASDGRWARSLTRWASKQDGWASDGRWASEGVWSISGINSKIRWARHRLARRGVGAVLSQM